MTKGKQSGNIIWTEKKQLGQSDTEQLISIASYIRQKYKVKVKREAYLLFNIDNKTKECQRVCNQSRS
jgi:hypothetical protein